MKEKVVKGDRMEIYELLESSFFDVKNNTGKVVYKEKSAMDSKEMDLLPTIDTVPKVSHKYKLLNPLQTLFYSLYKGGSSLVCAPTSAGKSLLAYIFMKDKPGRKVYVAPLRALVQEKTVEFKELFGNRVDMRTGESILEQFKPIRGEVLVTTYENLILAFRNNADWIQDTSCIIFDEIHQLVKNWSVEEAIIYALDLGIDILGLSATLPQYEKIAKWLNSSLTIYSKWRPVPLQRQADHLNNLVQSNNNLNGRPRDEQIAYKLLDVVSRYNKDEQVILFVPRKKLGWTLLEIANEEKINVMNETVPFEKQPDIDGIGPEIAFHNADVPSEEKQEIVKAFREGRLKTLVATHTLAYGLNLPADRTIIFVTQINSIDEGPTITPGPLDILQMEGRAGRLGIKDVGYSNIVGHGVKMDNVYSSLAEALSPQSRALKRHVDIDTLSMLILVGAHYKRKDYRQFLKKLLFSNLIQPKQIEDVERRLIEHQYINEEDYRLTEKGIYCMKSGVPPFKFEEFLTRLNLGMDRFVAVRPLLYTKNFKGLEGFTSRISLSDTQKQYIERLEGYVFSLLLLRKQACEEDGTREFLEYIHGKFFYYPNISHPPGAFSSLGIDVLHLMRTLIELKHRKLVNLLYEDILRIAHSIKTGLPYEFAYFGGIPGIGYIRSNLLKLYASEYLSKLPDFKDTVKDIFGDFTDREELKQNLASILSTARNLRKEKAEDEASKVVSILARNQNAHFIDEKILRGFALFAMNNRNVYRESKQKLINDLIAFLSANR